IERSEDGGRHIEPGQPPPSDRIALEIFLQGAEVGEAAYQLRRQAPQVAHPAQLREIIVARPRRLLLQERAPPFAHEIPRIAEEAAFQRAQRIAWIQHGRDRDDFRDIEIRSTRLRTDAQHEVAAERESDEPQWAAIHGQLQRTHGADHFRQEARMEETAVEMVCLAVVAQIEAQDVESAIEELLTER